MRRTVCLSVWERESCLFAEKLSVCAVAETSTPPTLHNLVSGPPLINFTAAFPESLWSDAGVWGGQTCAHITTAIRYVLENITHQQQSISKCMSSDVFLFKKGTTAMSTFMAFN